MSLPTRGARVGIKPNTPAWLAWRARGVTATDVATAMGFNPWNSPYNLWWSKNHDRATVAAGGVLTEMVRSARFQFGHDMEPILARHFERDVMPHGTRLGSGGCWQGKGIHGWLRATPDRILYPRRGRIPLAVVEFKTDNGGSFGDDTGDGVPVIPVAYRAQMLHQMMLAGVREGWLTVLTRNFDVRHYWVEAQPGEIDAIYQAAADFEESLHTGETPPIDGHDATADRIRGQYRDLNNEEVEVPADLAARYRAATAARKAAEEEEQEAKNLLLAAIGDGRYAVTPEGERVASRSVSWPKRPSASAVKGALDSLLPDFPFAPGVLTSTPAHPQITLRAAAPKKPTKGKQVTTTQEGDVA